MISQRVPDTMHVFNVFVPSGFRKFLRFVGHRYGVVGSTLSFLMRNVSMILPVKVVSVVSIQEPFSCFLLYSDHLLYCASEFFIVSWVFFAKVLKLPPSHDSVRELRLLLVR